MWVLIYKGTDMKDYVCDVCDSIRIGLSVGYKEFKDAFQQARQVRVYAKNGNYIKTDLPSSDMHIINDIRQLAQKNYKEFKEDDLHISESKNK